MISSNVDRIVAIWEALYPDSYVPPQSDFYGTYTIQPGSTDDVNTREWLERACGGTEADFFSPDPISY